MLIIIASDINTVVVVESVHVGTYNTAIIRVRMCSESTYTVSDNIHMTYQ